jgi:hypothetical protein
MMKEVSHLASKEATTTKTSSYSPAYKRMMMGLLLKSAMNEVMRRAAR